MGSPILIDSSIFIGLLRRRMDPTRELWEHFASLDLAVCGMVRVEVVRGLKAPRLRSRVEAFMDVMQSIPTDHRLWEEAAHMAWELDRQGRNLPAPDILIAVSALRIGAAVLSFDRHFSEIPRLRLAPVPPAWN